MGRGVSSAHAAGRGAAGGRTRGEADAEDAIARTMASSGGLGGNLCPHNSFLLLCKSFEERQQRVPSFAASNGRDQPPGSLRDGHQHLVRVLVHARPAGAQIIIRQGTEDAVSVVFLEVLTLVCELPLCRVLSSAAEVGSRDSEWAASEGDGASRQIWQHAARPERGMAPRKAEEGDYGCLTRQCLRRGGRGETDLRKGRSCDLLLSGPMLMAMVLIRFAATSCSHTSSILNSSTSSP